MYKDMVAILKDDAVGNFRISHFEITRDNWRALVFDRIPAGHYVRLTDGFECVMSDTPMEKCTNRDFCKKAHGKVLIGGLGIGMVLLAIQDKPEVESILVVEKHQEVIDLVAHQLPLNEKVTIIQGDVNEYEPTDKYNTIYIDIWNNVSRDVYEESMRPLRMKFRKYLVPKKEDEQRYIGCWAYENARDGKDW